MLWLNRYNFLVLYFCVANLRWEYLLWSIFLREKGYGNLHLRELTFAHRWKNRKNQNPQKFRATRLVNSTPMKSVCLYLFRWRVFRCLFSTDCPVQKTSFQLWRAAWRYLLTPLRGSQDTKRRGFNDVGLLSKVLRLKNEMTKDITVIGHYNHHHHHHNHHFQHHHRHHCQHHHRHNHHSQ